MITFKKIKKRYYFLFAFLILIITLSIILYMDYVKLVNNPKIIYYCDKEIASQIISEEDILLHSQSIFKNIDFLDIRAIYIHVSNPDLKHKTIDIMYIPLAFLYTQTLHYSMNDAPSFTYYYRH